MPDTDSTGTRRGVLGDARPDAVDPHRQKKGAQKPEKIEDRPSVGTVKPEDYPEGQRARNTGQ
ncbi:hypothetical protein LH128_08876 [Sphingomonas sp. LH128]|uniref:Uncharacterized protein n=1 Tax=Novosphingobium resinovorum TaxID=158500 RepID=A0A1D8AFN9_9SPHN|nr:MULTISPECIES: hypothetical protein [Sphingomonadaceae]AOR80934.1 hypothetical protein BES08_25715 [Novosphingobium resinovorum]EJU13422.1 hypothetical protein LH128_08876 [Sphingomonas sp. LH128]